MPGHSGQHLLHIPPKMTDPVSQTGIRAMPSLRFEIPANLVVGTGQLGCRSSAVCDVRVAQRETKLVVFAGSYYEVLAACEPLTGGAEVPRLLLYLAGEPHIAELSPLRELECIGGKQEPFQRPLKQMARAAFRGAGLADSKIDELIERTG